ncbi:DUF1566 domain-containing protein [Psychrobacter pygoscelis]|uniref:Lcl C-terminal domain-containing protein n=1 Tax=Psychrobacter pygoscelis TaxID=2488563 RepID=UPI0013F4A701|nr:DUF1566 domain-containing protein [Psychrobacter pygoscelis]
MQLHFQLRKLSVAITLAMSATILTACGGDSSGDDGGSNVPIVKEYDSFIEDSVGGEAFAGETIELPKLSKNGLPLKYRHRNNSEEVCTLLSDGYSVKLKPNTENKINRCDLWVDNQGGNARFKGISTAHVIEIYPVCENGQKNGEKTHRCIPAATMIEPLSAAPVTNVNQELNFTVIGYNLKGKLSDFKIETDACSDIKHSEEVFTGSNDKDSFTLTCTPDTAGTFELSIINSEDTTQLLKTPINIELPTVIGGNKTLTKTGVVSCANEETNNLPCTLEALGDKWYRLKQDGEVQAGADFSYSKKQYTNPKTNEQETCIQDNVTGLIWETKTDNDGLRDKDWTYNWYNTKSSENGGNAGSEGEDTCGDTLGSKCNTQAYIQKLNENQYCGYDDWRLPEQYELVSLLDFGREKPAINPIFKYVGDADFVAYWTNTTVGSKEDEAQAIDFSNGTVPYGKSKTWDSHYIRAVRAD